MPHYIVELYCFEDFPTHFSRFEIALLSCIHWPKSHISEPSSGIYFRPNIPLCLSPKLRHLSVLSKKGTAAWFTRSIKSEHVGCRHTVRNSATADGVEKLHIYCKRHFFFTVGLNHFFHSSDELAFSVIGAKAFPGP